MGSILVCRWGSWCLSDFLEFWRGYGEFFGGLVRFHIVVSGLRGLSGVLRDCGGFKRGLSGGLRDCGGF